jgi:uncharacterized Zn-binding protein involved in type VI secretion
MPASARITDLHVCPAVTGIVPHVGGPILPPCSINVMTNALNQARATDQATCVGPPDFIVTGSTSVMVNGLMAARQTDLTMHGGQIVLGSLNVNIGGPVGGATLGNTVKGGKICGQAATGRAGGSLQQSFQNCGVESSRQVILAAGGNVNEQALLNVSMALGYADRDTSNPANSGGTSPSGRSNILTVNGVANHTQTASQQNLLQAVAEGRGVITSHDAGKLWNNPAFNGGGHAVLVTGVQFDAKGKPANVIINDTGQGQCSNPVPVKQFMSSLRPGRDMNVTNNKVF